MRSDSCRERFRRFCETLRTLERRPMRPRARRRVTANGLLWTSTYHVRSRGTRLAAPKAAMLFDPAADWLGRVLPTRRDEPVFCLRAARWHPAFAPDRPSRAAAARRSRRRQGELVLGTGHPAAARSETRRGPLGILSGFPASCQLLFRGYWRGALPPSRCARWNH